MNANNSQEDNTNLSNTTNVNPNILLSETLECLSKTFTEKDNTERHKAERRLQELESNILVHIRTILMGLSSTNLSQELKLSIILYLKNILRSRIETRSFKKEEVMEIIQTFVELILLGNLNDQLLQNLNLGLTYLLNSFYITNDNQLIVNVCLFLLSHVIKREGLDMGIILQLKPVILLSQTIVSSQCVNSDNVFDVIGKQLETVNHMIKILGEKLKTFSIEDDITVYLACTDIIRCILDYLFLSLLKLKKLDSLDKILPIFINQLLPFVVYTITIPITNQSETNLISFTGNKEVDLNINSMKAKAFQVLSFTVQNEGSVIKNNFLLEVLSKIINLTISSLNSLVSDNNKLLYISEMSKNNKDFPDNNYDSVLFQMLLFLSRMLSREPVISQFTGYVKNFVLSVLFPFLMTSKADTILMKVEGEEFHNNLIDVIQNHKNKNFKTAASFLLTKLCDKYDGLSSFLINFSLQLIDYCLNGSDVNNISKYNILHSVMKQSKNELQGESSPNNFFTSSSSTSENFQIGIKKIITNFNPEIQMDVSLLILLILNTNVTRSSSFLAILRLILETHSDKIYTIQSEIIKDKLCLLFGTFLDDLYSEDEIEQFSIHLTHIFEFLFLQIFQYESNPGSAYSASYALNQLIYYKGYTDITNKIVRNLMPKLIEGVKEIEVVLFFDVIVDIVLYLDVEDFLMQLCREVTNRILKEIKTARRTKEKDLNVYNNKCFHILRTVLEKNKMYTPSDEIEVKVEPSSFIEVNEFENIIEPLVSYIKNPNKIDFEDEIVYLMINVIQSAKKVTNLSKKIFYSFPAYIIKNEGLTEDLFELLNLYIIYDQSEGFLTLKENVGTMLNIIKSSIEESEEYTLSPILASMLTQTWLQTCNRNNNVIPDNVVLEIISLNIREAEEIFNIYKDNLNELGSSFEVFNFSSYLSTIYAGFITYPILSLTKINDMDVFFDFITWTELLLHFSYFSTYQSKIIILGICSILSNQNLITQFDVQIVNKFFSIVFSLLLKQKNEETNKLKSAMKKEIECNFIHSDEEEEYYDDEDDDEDPTGVNLKRFTNKLQQIQDENNNYSSREEKQINKIQNKLKAPSKEIDEYEVFNHTLQNIQSFNNNLVSEWINNLDDSHKSLWNELIHTRRIKVDFSGNKLDVPRRTVRIKRSNNN